MKKQENDTALYHAETWMKNLLAGFLTMDNESAITLLQAASPEFCTLTARGSKPWKKIHREAKMLIESCVHEASINAIGKLANNKEHPGMEVFFGVLQLLLEHHHPECNPQGEKQ